MSNKGQILLKDKSERFSFRLDADTSRQLHTMADEMGMSPSNVVRLLIQQHWAARASATSILNNAIRTGFAVAERAAKNEDNKAD